MHPIIDTIIFFITNVFCDLKILSVIYSMIRFFKAVSFYSLYLLLNSINWYFFGMIGTVYINFYAYTVYIYTNKKIFTTYHKALKNNKEATQYLEKYITLYNEKWKIDNYGIQDIINHIQKKIEKIYTK